MDDVDDGSCILYEELPCSTANSLTVAVEINHHPENQANFLSLQNYTTIESSKKYAIFRKYFLTRLDDILDFTVHTRSKVFFYYKGLSLLLVCSQLLGT